MTHGAAARAAAARRRPPDDRRRRRRHADDALRRHRPGPARRAAPRAHAPHAPQHAAADADRGRSDLLHDGPEIHDVREDAAGRSRCSTKTLKGGTRAGVQLSLSKISTVRLTVRQGGAHGVDEQRLPRHAASRSCCGSTPAGGGTFSVTLSATDPAGNFATATGTIVVSHG